MTLFVAMIPLGHFTHKRIGENSVKPASLLATAGSLREQRAALHTTSHIEPHHNRR